MLLDVGVENRPALGLRHDALHLCEWAMTGEALRGTARRVVAEHSDGEARPG